MTTTATCPVCTQTFPCTPHQRPRRRYCSDRCRKTAWQRRRTTNPHQPGAAAARPRNVTDAGTAHPHCPHCSQPIAVITLLITPAAAHVNTPGAHHDR